MSAYFTVAMCLTHTANIEKFLMIHSYPDGPPIANVEPQTFKCDSKEQLLAFLASAGDQIWDGYKAREAELLAKK